MQTLSRNVLGIALVLSTLLCKKIGKEFVNIGLYCANGMYRPFLLVIHEVIKIVVVVSKALFTLLVLREVIKIR